MSAKTPGRPPAQKYRLGFTTQSGLSPAVNRALAQQLANADEMFETLFTEARKLRALIIAGGIGDVSGPDGATDHAVVLYDGTTGKLIRDSTVLLGDLATTHHHTTHEVGGSDVVTLAQSQIVNLTTDLAAKAPIASPALTGTPTAPTAAVGTNTTQLASTAFVTAAVAASPAGDVEGPSSATDNALARWDGTTGKLAQNSVGILSDAGVLAVAQVNLPLAGKLAFRDTANANDRRAIGSETGDLVVLGDTGVTGVVPSANNAFALGAATRRFLTVNATSFTQGNNTVASGALRTSNNVAAVVSRNKDNTGDIELLKADNADQIFVGQTNFGARICTMGYATGATKFWGKIHEQQRTAPLGTFVLNPYTAGDFTTNDVSATWTVDNADEEIYYALIGNTMLISFFLSTTTLSGASAATTMLQIKIPLGNLAAASFVGTFWWTNGGVSGVGLLNPNGPMIQLFKDPATTPWVNGTNDLYIQGTAMIPLN